MRFNLSEVNELIRDRRTIFPEQFSSRKVHKEIIEVLLENARWAPTHRYTQPWFYKVFMGEGLTKFGEFHAETYKKITPVENFSEKKYHKLLNRTKKSSAIIVACMKRDREESVPEIEEVAAVSTSIQNMFLTATAYGLAFYWGSGGLTYKDEMKQFIGLEDQDKVLGILHVGYPDVEWPNKTKRNTRDTYVEWVEE